MSATPTRPSDVLAPDERALIIGSGVTGWECSVTSDGHQGYFKGKSGEDQHEVYRQALQISRLARRNAEDAAKLQGAGATLQTGA